MLTKKHFEAIAKIMREHHDKEHKHTETYNTVDEIIGDLASYLRDENPLFDWIRFVKACGIGTES